MMVYLLYNKLQESSHRKKNRKKDLSQLSVCIQVGEILMLELREVVVYMQEREDKRCIEL
jgi:hypothetical protein